MYARDLSDTLSEIDRFKIGEGGFTGSPKVPKTPDPTIVDLESEGAELSGGGTADFSNGSVTVDNGSDFLSDVSPGDWIKPGPTPGGSAGSAGTPGTEVDEWGEVQTVVSDSEITLVSPYTGPTLSGRPVRKASDPLFTFRKQLTDSDVLFHSAVPAIDEITAIVDTSEANSNQQGNNPEFFELGLFDANGVMVVYMTFDLQTKISSVQLNNIVQLVY